MKILSKAFGASCAVALSLVANQAIAKVDAAEAAKIGTTLTPVGAEKAANKEGTIPAWAPAPQAGSPTG